jgi:ribose transport system substrate-binding protein
MTRQRPRRRMALFVAALSTVLPLAACAAPAEPVAPLVIGLSVSDLGNPYFLKLAEGAAAEARLHYPGAVDVRMVSSAYDENRQIRQIDDFIQQGVSLILLVAASEHGLNDAIQRARSAAIPVLAVDVKAESADLSITTNNRQAGEIACQYLAEQLGFQGKIVVLNGPAVSSVIERTQGCLGVLAKHPALEVLSNDRNGGGSRLGGLEIMTHLLTAFPHIDGVFAINDPTALGAEQAAHLSGRRFLLVSVDGSPDARQQLQQADSLLIASASQSPEQMARLAIREGLAMLNHQPASSGELLLPSTLLTRDDPGAHDEW